MTKNKLSHSSELRDLNENYAKSNRLRKKIKIGTAITKKVAYLTCGGNAAISLVQGIGSLAGIDGATEAIHKLITNHQSEASFNISEMALGTISSAVTDFQANPELCILALSVLGGCVVVDKWASHKDKAQDKTRFDLDYINSPFYGELQDKVSKYQLSAYRTFSHELSEAATSKSIYKESKGQKYSSAVAIDQVELRELQDLLLGAAELTEFVLHSDSEIASFLRTKCEELMLSKSNMASYLSLPEVREHLIKARSGERKADVFVNNYINAIAGMEKELLFEPSIGTPSLENQITSIKNQMLFEAKEISDANLALNAFSNDVFDIIKDAKTAGFVSEERITAAIDSLESFLHLPKYKSSSERWSPLYDGLSKAATALIEDLTGEDLSFSRFSKSIAAPQEQAFHTSYDLTATLANTLDKSNILSSSKSQTDFMVFACQNIVEDTICNVALRKKHMSYNEAREYAKVQTAMIDTKVAHLELSEHALKYQKITRKNDSFLSRLAQKIALHKNNEFSL